MDTDQKNEISENKFFRFLRDHKILAEKKQVDEMIKQCLISPNTLNENILGTTVS